MIMGNPYFSFFFFLLVILFLPVPHCLQAWERFLSDNSSTSLYNCVIKPKLSKLMSSPFPNTTDPDILVIKWELSFLVKRAGLQLEKMLRV